MDGLLGPRVDARPQPLIAGARRGALALALLAALLGGCSDPSPSSTPGGSPGGSRASATPSEGTDGGSPGTGGLNLPDPGRPYDGDDVMSAMRTSVRPDGVPEELQTDAIADAVAEELWTFDGDPWQSLVAGGSCGPDTCTLELSGAPPGGAGEDLYVFSVDLPSGEVSLSATTLHGYPESLEGSIDDVVRTGVDAADLEGLMLAGALWLPPPEPENRFLVAYRTAGEERSPAVDVLIDLGTGAVLEVRPAQE